MKTGGARRLLLFAYYFPPLGGAGSLRALSFARHLPALGWRVTVVTPEEGVYGRDASLSAEGMPGVEVVRTASWEPATLLRKVRRAGRADEGASGGGSYVEEARLGPLGQIARGAARRWLYFPDSARGWIRHAVAAAARAHRKAPFDAVLSSSPPVSAHLAARESARKLGIPWIADWRDPWTAHMGAKEAGRTRARALEKELLEIAAGLVVATRGVGEILRAIHPELSPPTVVRNGYEPAEFPPRTPVPGRILHAGTVNGASQDLSTFLRRFAARPGPTLLLLGKVDGGTQALVEDLGLGSRVEIRGFATHRDSVAAMGEADLLLLPTWNVDSPAGRAVCPAKMAEYLAAGRPILALGREGSEALELLRGVPGVAACGFDDGDAMDRVLAALGERAAPGVRGREEILATLTRERQARVLAEALQACAGRPVKS